jgi:RNA recognition motif-containing protein
MDEAELEEFVERSKRCRIYIKRLPFEFNNDTLRSYFE